MKDHVKTQNRNKKGFSLTEVLVAVSLLIILTGLAAIEVPRYLRSMTQLERDGIAKEIFVAAQNNLSQVAGQGYLQKNTSGAFGIPESGSQEIFYYVVGAEDGSESPANSDSILSSILPSMSIDETVRGGGSYVIRYQKTAGLVLDVFYIEPSGRFGRSFTKDDYESLLANKGDEFKKDRRFFGSEKLVVGYYGGVNPVSAVVTAELKAPILVVTNAEKLTLAVNPQMQEGTIKDQVNYRLIITGESSGVSWTKELGSLTDHAVPYNLTLDDITTVGAHFSDFCTTEGVSFLPGENLRIKAQAYIAQNGTDVRVSESEEETVNSLFGSLSGGKAEIGNIRHLENLSAEISGFTGKLNGSPVSQAVQTTDLSWGDFREVIGSTVVNVYDKNGVPSADNGFLPVNPLAALSYDGGGFTISGLKIAVSGNAGLFGEMITDSSVQNLRLVDFSVSAAGGNAGALAGELAGTTVTGVLCYNDITTGSSDAVLEITAIGTAADVGNAGGLIGFMDGGSVEGCAAALYVKAENAAGGLIGYAKDAESVTSSYAGGHTENARYQQAITGAARINVQGGTAGGGLIGKLDGPTEKTLVQYCYTTSSVSSAASGYSGGFIGVLSDADVKDCYTTAFVKAKETGETGKAQTFIGSGNASVNCTYGGKLYYLTNLSPKVDNDITAVSGISGKDTGRPDFIFVGSDAVVAKRQPSYIYDDTLKVDYGGKFYFPTVNQFGGALYEGITDIHYGDWQVPYLDTLDYMFVNEDTLYLKIDPARLGDKKYFIIALTGEISTTGSNSREDKSVFYLINAEDPTHPSIVNQGRMVNSGGANVIGWSGSVTNKLPVSYREDGCIHIVLDDITVAGHHFSQLFNGTVLIPGENITARLIIGNNAGVNEIFEMDGLTENSLFAYSTNGYSTDPVITSGYSSGAAVIGYTRHLQNLDPQVSDLRDYVNGTMRITKAFLRNSIEWDGSVYPQITACDTASIVLAGTSEKPAFYGICPNQALAKFDGNNCCLSGYPFIPSGVGEYGTNAGLFRYIGTTNSTSGPMEIHDLELCDCRAEAVGGDAGILIAGAGNGANVLVDTVFVHHSPGESVDPEDYAVKSTGTGCSAGGLIGSVQAPLAVENSSASVLVRSKGPAGGLIGSAAGGAAVSISRCYSGGHTTNGKYIEDFDAADETEYNILSTVSAAGGLVGMTSGGARVSVTQSFGAISVAGSAAGGGLVGSLNGGTYVSLDTVYTIAPVQGVAGSETPDGKNGAVIGIIEAGCTVTNAASSTNDDEGTVFFLPELYVGNEEDLSGVPVVGYGNLTKDARYAYYQKNNSEILIAAKEKNYHITIQDRTVPYDQNLSINERGYVREYPFSIWTSFPETDISKTDGFYLGKYYGDWQPVEMSATKRGTITFKYRNPETEQEVSVKQELHLEESNKILTPYVERFVGYELYNWQLYSEYAAGKETTLKDSNGNDIFVKDVQGFLNLPKEYCMGDLVAVARFKNASVESTDYLIRFWYDENLGAEGTMPKWVQLGKTLKMPGSTKLDDLAVEAPVKNIDGYYLFSWCSDRELSETVTLSGTSPLSSLNLLNKYEPHYIDLYADYQYLDFYTITIDFMYAFEGKYEHLLSVPRYSLEDGNHAQYRLKYLKGRWVDEYIEMPDASNLQFLEVTDYRGSSNVGNFATYTVDTANGDRLHLQNLNGETENAVYNYIVVYKRDEGEALYSYQIDFVLEDTADDGSYAAGASKRFNAYADYAASHPNEFKAQLNDSPNVAAYDAKKAEKGVYSIPDGINMDGYTFKEIKPVVISEDENSNVIEIHYSRKQFRIDFQPLGGEYIATEYFYSGQPITKPSGDNPKRTGYTFDETKTGTAAGWSILEYQDSFEEGTATKYQWGAAMPAKNLKAWPNWASSLANYNIVFWLENANDNEYSYLGTASTDSSGKALQAMTGTRLKYGESNFFTHGSNHTLACYEGVGDKIYHEAEVVTYSGITGISVNGTFIEGVSETKTDYTEFTAKDGTVYNVYPKWQIKDGYNNSWKDVTRTSASDKPDSQTYSYNRQTVTLNSNKTKWNYYTGTKDARKKDNTFEIYYNGNWTTDLVLNAEKPSEFVWSDTYHNQKITISEPNGTPLSGNSASPAGYVKANGYIANWAASDGSTGKCICWNGTWSYYDGAAAPGSIATCSKVTSMEPNTKTVNVPFNSGDSADYYYFERCDEVSVQSDGTTVVNVYLKRKHYTVRFEIGFWDGSQFQISTANGTYAWEDFNKFFSNGTPKNLGESLPFDLKALYDINVNRANDGAVVRKAFLGNVKEKAGDTKEYLSICVDLTAKYGQEIENEWIGTPPGMSAGENSYVCGGWLFPQYSSEGRQISKNGVIVDALPSNASSSSAGNHAAIKGQKGSMSRLIITVNGQRTAVEDNASLPTLELRSRYRNSGQTFIYVNHFKGIDGGAETVVCSGPYYGGSQPNEQKPSSHEGFQDCNATSLGSDTYYSQGSYNDISKIADAAAKAYAQDLSSKNLWFWPGTSKNLYVIHFVFERETYSLDFYVAGTKTKTVSKQYQASLKDPDNRNYEPARPENIPSDYTFDGWYQNAQCTGDKYNLETHTMPASNLVLYGRWLPPAYEVSFDLNDPDSTDGKVPCWSEAAVAKETGKVETALVHYKNIAAPGADPNYDPYQFVVRSGSNISEYTTDEKGMDLAAYTPVKEGYIFTQWKYHVRGQNKAENDPGFILSTPVSNDIVVYACWKKDEVVVEEAPVLVLYEFFDENRNLQKYYMNSSGAFVKYNPAEYIFEDDPSLPKYKVGTTVSFNAKDVPNCYPLYMVLDVLVQSDTSKNVVTFSYREITGWTYTIQYYASYRNFADPAQIPSGDISGITFASEALDIPIGTSQTATASNQYEPVSFTMPAGYENYRLVKVDANGQVNRTSDPHATLAHRASGENVIKFYIEPMTEKFYLDNRFVMYNGSADVAISSEVVSIPGMVYPTTNVTVTDYYSYYDSDGNRLNANNIVNVGAYRMNGYMVLAINGNNYLLCEEHNRGLNLRIQQRPVIIISASAEKAAGGAPLVLSTPTVIPAVTDKLTGDDLTAFLTEHSARFEVIDSTPYSVKKSDGTTTVTFNIPDVGLWGRGWYVEDSDILLLGPDDGYAPIVDENVETPLDIHFSVEAFRMTKGISSNSFVYEVTGLTDIQKANYQFSTVFGDLKVN